MFVLCAKQRAVFSKIHLDGILCFLQLRMEEGAFIEFVKKVAHGKTACGSVDITRFVRRCNSGCKGV